MNIKTISLALACLCPLCVQAQTPAFDINTESLRKLVRQRPGCDEMLYRSVMPGVTVVYSSFQLQDPESDDVFGLNGNDEFGISYSIAFQTHGSLILSEPAVMPWKHNPKFEKYAGRYNPVLYETRYVDTTDSVDSRNFDIDLNNLRVLADTDSALYALDTTQFDNTAFRCDSTAGKKDGWIVWLAAGSDEALMTGEINRAVTFASFDIKPGQAPLTAEIPATDGDIVGGMFVVPEYTATGLITLKLVGIAVKNNYVWNIAFPFAVQDSLPSVYSGRDDSVLTPIRRNDNKKTGDGKKNKKNRK